MTKRKKFLLSSASLSIGLLVMQFIPLDYRYVAVFGFFLVTYLVSAWALYEDLRGIEWLTVLTLPSLFSVGVGLFYFLLPDNTWSKVVILTLFGFGLYAIYLTENIYSVAAFRTIQLLRAAHAVGFLLSVLTLVLVYNTIFSLKWVWWMNGLLVMLSSFPMLVQALWSVKLQAKLTSDVWLPSMGLSVTLGELAMVLSFLPSTVWISSLFLATGVYVSMGLLQHALEERLFVRTIYEYLSVGILVLIATLVVIPWK